jgi:hypothetical protein
VREGGVDLVEVVERRAEGHAGHDVVMVWLSGVQYEAEVARCFMWLAGAASGQPGGPEQLARVRRQLQRLARGLPRSRIRTGLERHTELLCRAVH